MLVEVQSPRGDELVFSASHDNVCVLAFCLEHSNTVESVNISNLFRSFQFPCRTLLHFHLELITSDLLGSIFHQI